ncbi:MAG TPA: hypothetical protein VGK90_13640 [Rhizomicrobium sp.]
MRDDAVTVGAITIIAMCVATVAHEAIGHGSVCLLLGGHITLLTNVYFRCAVESTLVSPSGPLGNLMAGLAGAAALQCLPSSYPRAKLFALLVTAFSFFWAFGYLIYSLATGDGDYAIAIRDFTGGLTTVWRIAGIAVGAVLYLLFRNELVAAITRLLGQRATHVMRISWLIATLAAVAAAALYTPGRKGAMIQAGLEIGAASLPLLTARPHAEGTGEMPVIARNVVWIAVAVISFAAFALTLGVGYAS